MAKDGLTAAQKRSVRKSIDEATKDKLYDYDRIAARTEAVRQAAAEHDVTPAEIEQALADTRMADPDPGINAVDTNPVVDEDAQRPVDVDHALQHQAAATPGMVEKDNDKVAREDDKAAKAAEREREKEAKAEEKKSEPAKKAPAKAPAKKAPAKKAPAKTTGTSGRSTSSSSRR